MCLEVESSAVEVDNTPSRRCEYVERVLSRHATTRAGDVGRTFIRPHPPLSRQTDDSVNCARRARGRSWRDGPGSRPPDTSSWTLVGCGPRPHSVAPSPRGSSRRGARRARARSTGTITFGPSDVKWLVSKTAPKSTQAHNRRTQSGARVHRPSLAASCPTRFDCYSEVETDCAVIPLANALDGLLGSHDGRAAAMGLVLHVD